MKSEAASTRPPPSRRRPFRRLLVGVAVLAVACVTARGCLRVPRTESVPPGLYLLTYDTPQRGKFIVACLPERLGAYARKRGYLAPGRCPGGVSEVVKRVAALPGDLVVVDESGLTVNGTPLPRTARLRRDSDGRPVAAVPPGRYRVEPGTVWLYATHSPKSWDSRYYGAVPLGGVRSTALRLWTSRDLSD
jgi:conjugative transfer signal peptidase TraF